MKLATTFILSCVLVGMSFQVQAEDTKLQRNKKEVIQKLDDQIAKLDDKKKELDKQKSEVSASTDAKKLAEITVKEGLESDWLNLYGIATNTSFLNGDTKSTSTQGKGLVAEIQWKQKWGNSGVWWPFFTYRSFSEDPVETKTANPSGGEDSTNAKHSWKAWELGLRWYWPSASTTMRAGLILAAGREAIESTTEFKPAGSVKGTQTDATLTGGTGRIGFRLDRINQSDPQYGSFAEIGIANDRRFEKSTRIYLMGRYTLLGDKSLQVFIEGRTSFYPNASHEDKYKLKDEFSLVLGVKVPVSSLFPKAATSE